MSSVVMAQVFLLAWDVNHVSDYFGCFAKAVYMPVKHSPHMTRSGLLQCGESAHRWSTVSPSHVTSISAHFHCFKPPLATLFVTKQCFTLRL